MKIFRRTPAPGPSAEAIAARDQAAQLSEKSVEVFTEREFLMKRNKFGERIRLIYEAGS